MEVISLPSGWLKARLADVVEPRGEKADPAQCPDARFIGMDHVEAHTTRIVGDVPAASMKSGAARFYPGDVLYGRLRPYLNKVAQPGFAGLASAEFMVFAGNPIVDAKFLKHRLNAADFVSFASHLNEGDRPRVSFEQIGEFEVWIPSIGEQRRIVAKIEELFSELDKGVESLKLAREQLRVYRQALLKHAFEGKLTAAWREENADMLEPASTLLERIRGEREHRYRRQITEWEQAVGQWKLNGENQRKPPRPGKPKTLPPLRAEELANFQDLPAGWGWVRFGEIFADSPKNGLYKPANDYGSGVAVIRIDDFYDGRLIRKSGFKRLRITDEELDAFAVADGDILVNRVNSIEYLGKCCVVGGLLERTVFESNIMKLTLLPDFMLASFATQYLSSHAGRTTLRSNAKHAVNQASINQTDVAMAPVPLPSIAEQVELMRSLESALTQVASMEREIDVAAAKSAALRQSILKRAFSGQLIPQDPNNEPAPALLERIRAARSGAANGGRARKVRR